MTVTPRNIQRRPTPTQTHGFGSAHPTPTPLFLKFVSRSDVESHMSCYHFDIVFSDRDPCVLIGEDNVGKEHTERETVSLTEYEMMLYNDA